MRRNKLLNYIQIKREVIKLFANSIAMLPGIFAINYDKTLIKRAFGIIFACVNNSID